MPAHDRQPNEPTFAEESRPGARVQRSFPAEGMRMMLHHNLPLPECPAFEQIDEAVLEPDYQLPMHRHAAYEIVYVHRGIYDRLIGAEAHRLVPGDLHIVRPGELHGGRADPTGGILHKFSVAIDPAKLPLVSSAMGAAPVGAASGDDVARDVANSFAQVAAFDEAPGLLDRRVIHGGFGAEVIYRKILAELDRPLSSNALRDRALQIVSVQILLIELLVFIARCQSNEVGRASASHLVPSRPEFHRLLGWLRTRLDSPPSVTEMAEWVGLSPAHFALTFKAETGSTALEYLTALRIEEAAARLARPNAPPVTEVALALGYSPHYFSVLFKKLKGSSPRAWRQRHAGD